MSTIKKAIQIPRLHVYDCASAAYDATHTMDLCSLALPSRFDVDYAGISQTMGKNNAWGLIGLVRYLNKKAKTMSKNTVLVYFSLKEYLEWESKTRSLNLHQTMGNDGMCQAVEKLANEFFDCIFIISGVDIRAEQSVLQYMKIKNLTLEEVAAETGIPADRLHNLLQPVMEGTGISQQTSAETVALRQFLKRFPVNNKDFDAYRNMQWVERRDS